MSDVTNCSKEINEVLNKYGFILHVDHKLTIIGDKFDVEHDLKFLKLKQENKDELQNSTEINKKK